MSRRIRLVHSARPSLIEPLEARQLMSAVVTDVSRLIFSDIMGGAASPSQSVTLTNNGDSTVALTGVSITGTGAAKFGSTFSAISLLPGDSTTVPVTFNPSAAGPLGAQLNIATDEVVAPGVAVTLRGLGTAGLQGNLEPSLQWILDTFQIPVNVGDSNPATSVIDFPAKIPNDEVTMQQLVKAGDGPVTIELLAAYTNDANPGGYVGIYDPATLARTQLMTILSQDVQTLNPRTTGLNTFDPGTSPLRFSRSGPRL